MKQLTGPALIFVGTLLIAGAVAVSSWLVPKMTVVPLDLDITSVAESVPAGITDHDDTPALMFDRCSVSGPRAKVVEAHLTQQRRTVVIEPSDDKQVTLQSGQTVRIDKTRDGDAVVTPQVQPNLAARTCADGILVSGVDVVSLDRETSRPNGAVHRLHTGEAPEGTITSAGDDNFVDIPRDGYQYKFGFDVEKTDQPYHDLGSRKDWPAQFIGERTVNGLKAYDFESVVPETNQTTLLTPDGQEPLGSSLTMPAQWWGISGPGIDPKQPIEMFRYGTATRRVTVEPKTGTVLDGGEDQYQYFRVPDGADVPDEVKDFRLVVGKSTVAWSDETVANQSDKASGYVRLLDAANIGSIVAGVVGGITLIAGVVITVRRPRSTAAVE